MFGFMRGSFCCGRFFTFRLSRLVVRRVYQLLSLHPDRDPEESLSAWVSKQAKRLQYIAMRVKRSYYHVEPLRSKKPSGPAKRAMALDNVETVPYDFQWPPLEDTGCDVSAHMSGSVYI